MRTPDRPVFVVRLRAGSKDDAVRQLKAALKLLGRRFRLKAVSVTVEKPPEERRTVN
jgi:hypothetical protein